MVEIGLLAQAGEDVGHGAATGFRVERLIGGDEPDARGAREADEPLERPLAVTIEMALDLDEAPIAAEQTNERDQSLEGVVVTPGADQPRQRTVRAAGETDEAVGMSLEVGQRESRLAFGRRELHSGQQPGQIAVSRAVFHQ